MGTSHGAVLAERAAQGHPLVWWRRVSVWSIAHGEQPLFRAASPVSLLGLRLTF